MTAPVFELRQVSCRFGDTLALSDLSLTIAAGERVALVGASGAGKSTLLSLLNGALLPSAGEVWVMGQAIAGLSTRQLRRVQRQIGTVYQQHHLVANLAVIHNVNAGHLGRWPLWQAIWSLVWPLAVKTADQALAQVGIAEKLYARTDRLSGGQQQRVAIARVLVQDPAVILADEPISSVDPERSQAIMDLLRQLSLRLGKTLVVSLHDIEFARSHCDRMIGLRAGRLLFDAPARAVSPAMIEALYRL
jgi:phosphonate transport system ATP-binding protein